MRLSAIDERAFDRFLGLRRALWCILDQSRDTPRATLPAKIHALARAFGDIAREAPDAVLCSLLLDESAAYAQAHPAMVGTLCAVLADRICLPPDVRLTTIAAALTCNLGMLSVHESAAIHRHALTPEQQTEVHTHPLRSAAMLRAAGVTDELWLQIVSHHHERPDGTGYPHGVRGTLLGRPARLVALADVYAAMVLPRHYRDGVHAQQALREIFLQRGMQIDAALAADFINTLGVFPPGIFVRLSNGETGVVIQRGTARASDPVVSCFRSPRGGTYMRPLHRDTASRAGFAIAEVLRRQPLPCSISGLWRAA